MSATTGIEWCDHTFSPWIGCTPVSAACDHCYAAAMMQRWGRARYEAGAPRVLTAESTWRRLATWDRKAAVAGRRARVFPSLCDPFDAEVPDDWRARFMLAIMATPHLEWLLLTKRPSVARKWFDGRGVPGNVRLGITAEAHDLLEQRTRELMAIRARLLPFLSAEPLLGALRLDDIDDHGASRDALRGEVWVPGAGSISSRTVRANRFGWVIAGGESGPKARPSHPDWFRSLRDQCQAADVPFFFKQWGEWVPLIDRDKDDPDWRMDYTNTYPDSRRHSLAWLNLAGGCGFHGQRFHVLRRVGKSKAGATLDGREWREFPT